MEELVVERVSHFHYISNGFFDYHHTTSTLWLKPAVTVQLVEKCVFHEIFWSMISRYVGTVCLLRCSLPWQMPGVLLTDQLELWSF